MIGDVLNLELNCEEVHQEMVSIYLGGCFLPRVVESVPLETRMHALTIKRVVHKLMKTKRSVVGWWA